jgi:hypothetical protein
MFAGFQDNWSSDRNNEGFYSETGFVGHWSQIPGESPSITNNLSEFVEVHEGESVSFIVRAKSMPAAKYYWLTNGVAVGGISTNQYFIASVLPCDDQTTYQCIASNVFGSATSQLAHLSVIANGILDVSISPPSAVATGAVWQVIGGIWRTNGPIALPPDTYTVAFSNLAHLGWTTPLTRDVVIVSSQTTTVSVVYTAPVATAVRTVTNWTNVSLAVTCPPSNVVWTLVENLPVYVTPTNYFPGVWTAGASRTLTYTGSGAATLTYTTLISTNGDFPISGVITSMPINVTMSTGTNNVSRGDLLRKIVGTNVWIYMFVPTSPSQWFLTENLGPNLTSSASSLTGPGTWYPGSKQIIWSSLSSAGEIPLSYRVSGVAGSSNILFGSCFILGEGSTRPIYGDSVVIIPQPAPEPPPPPTILSFVLNGASASLIFTSVVSQAYMVVTNANLAMTNGWGNYLQTTGTVGTTTVVVPVVPPQLFYRVKIE